MFLDAQNLFSDAQAITASAGSTNIIDLGIFTTTSGTAAERRIGTGENLYIFSLLDVAMTDAGSDSTVTVTLESDDDAAFPSATTRQTLFTFAAVSAAGTIAFARIQPEILTEQFIRLFYTVAGGNLTTGSFTSGVVHDIDAFTAYPRNYIVTSS